MRWGDRSILRELNLSRRVQSLDGQWQIPQEPLGNLAKPLFPGSSASVANSPQCFNSLWVSDGDVGWRMMGGG